MIEMILTLVFYLEIICLIWLIVGRGQHAGRGRRAELLRAPGRLRGVLQERRHPLRLHARGQQRQPLGILGHLRQHAAAADGRSSSVRNRNYFLRFRFRLLTSYGSGFDFWQATVPVPSDFWQVRFRLRNVLVSRPKKAQLKKKFLWTKIAFLHCNLFYTENIYKFHQIYCKMWMKKMLNEGYQIHNFILFLWELLWFHLLRFRSEYFGSPSYCAYGSGSSEKWCDTTLIRGVYFSVGPADYMDGDLTPPPLSSTSLVI